MSIKVEFHCHTSNSFDCDVKLIERIKVYSKLGFSHLVITDHDKVLNHIDYSIIESNDEYSIEIIPGIEISTQVGHVILLNCRKKPWFNSLFFIVLWSKYFKSNIYLPHPFRNGTGLLIQYPIRRIPTYYVSWFLNFVTYIEVYNPRDNISKVVDVHYAIYRKLLYKKYVSASDSHYNDDINFEGSSFEGFAIENQNVSSFFSKINVTNNKVSFTLRSFLSYFKNSLSYIFN